MSRAHAKPRSSAQESAFLKRESSAIKRPLSLSIALSFGAGIFMIGQMGLLAYIIHAILVEGTGLEELAWALLSLPLVFFARSVLGYLSERLALHAAIDLKHVLRQRFLRRITERGPIVSRNKEQAAGDDVTLLTEGIEALEGYFARYLPAMVMMVLLPFAILTVTLSYDWLSALVMVVTAPLIPFFMILIGKGTEHLNQKQWRKLARLSAHFLDMIQGLTTLKLFNMSRREAETVSRMADDYRHTTMGVLRVAFLSSLVLEFFSTISIAIIAVFIGFRLLYGEMDFFAGFYILLLAPEFYFPLRQMGSHYHARLEAIGAAERMVDLLAEDASNGVPASEKAGSSLMLADRGAIALRFESVSFSYDDGTKALDDVSFTLSAGESLAIVGASGAGKSSLMDLLLGLIRPTEGRILVNGTDLALFQLEEWRSVLAYMPQQSHLMGATLHDAIAYGRPDASREEVISAAIAANADTFISDLSGGYDHPLGEKGQGLSGGQVQRIALARALLRDAPLLLLDEPSAHLDRETEADVQQALERQKARCSSITIAHRLHTIEQADKILVLDNGRIVEEGSHRVLMDQGGVYAGLVTAQFSVQASCEGAE